MIAQRLPTTTARGKRDITECSYEYDILQSNTKNIQQNPQNCFIAAIIAPTKVKESGYEFYLGEQKKYENLTIPSLNESYAYNITQAFTVKYGVGIFYVKNSLVE